MCAVLFFWSYAKQPLKSFVVHWSSSQFVYTASAHIVRTKSMWRKINQSPCHGVENVHTTYGKKIVFEEHYDVPVELTFMFKKCHHIFDIIDIFWEVVTKCMNSWVTGQNMIFWGQGDFELVNKIVISQSLSISGCLCQNKGMSLPESRSWKYCGLEMGSWWMWKHKAPPAPTVTGAEE